MPTVNFPLPTMTQSSSAVDTSTGSVPAWDVSDAEAITIIFDGSSTAPGPMVQVAFTTQSTANFLPLNIFTTGGVLTIITSSASATHISSLAASQLRVITTSIRTGTGLHTAVKRVVV